MDAGAILRRHQKAILATVPFLIMTTVVVAFYYGYVPVIPRSMPMFAYLVVITLVTVAIAIIAWLVSTNAHPIVGLGLVSCGLALVIEADISEPPVMFGSVLLVIGVPVLLYALYTRSDQMLEAASQQW